jgi:hypothetical protein
MLSAVVLRVDVPEPFPARVVLKKLCGRGGYTKAEALRFCNEVVRRVPGLPVVADLDSVNPKAGERGLRFQLVYCWNHFLKRLFVNWFGDKNAVIDNHGAVIFE